jgi:hypothetical protein
MKMENMGNWNKISRRNCYPVVPPSAKIFLSLMVLMGRQRKAMQLDLVPGSARLEVYERRNEMTQPA